jgi:hypothetical protein
MATFKIESKRVFSAQQRKPEPHLHVIGELPSKVICFSPKGIKDDFKTLDQNKNRQYVIMSKRKYDENYSPNMLNWVIFKGKLLGRTKLSKVRHD